MLNVNRNQRKQFQCLEVYFADHLLYSNMIYTKSKISVDINLLGILTIVPTCAVLSFLDYKFLMTRVRYLNKSFLTLTQNKLHYMPGLRRKAVLKVSLHEVYQGQERMPMLNHPYYTHCTELKVIYQV